MLRDSWEMIRGLLIVYGPYIFILWAAWTFYMAYETKLQINNATTEEDRLYKKASYIFKIVWGVILLTYSVRLFFY